MKYCKPFCSIDENDFLQTGGKAQVLSNLKNLDFNIPEGFCILTDSYLEFITHSGISQQIKYELSRFAIENLRWEEIWDISLRIKHLFLTTEIPEDIAEQIAESLKHTQAESYAVRSSSPSEDSGNFTFAGLHESYVGVSGIENILKSVKKVWASLWCDKALLYRKEMNLDPAKSTMAVIVQDFIRGERSGVAFTKSPENPDNMVFESIPGINQALVDGEKDPDRLIVNRKDLNIITFKKSQEIISPEYKSGAGDFNSVKWLNNLFETVLRIESEYNFPQDIEWTVNDGKIWILQARNITTVDEESSTKIWDNEDKRPWYKSLTRSYDNLIRIGDKIKNTILPEMEVDSERLKNEDLVDLDNNQLLINIKKRKKLLDKWIETYWEYCIPFAHGVRMFASFYNENSDSNDPFEFLQLLEDTELISVGRNKVLEELIDEASADDKIKSALSGDFTKDLPTAYLSRMNMLYNEFLTMSYKGNTFFSSIEELAEFLGKHSSKNYKRNTKKTSDESRKNDFINNLSPGTKRETGIKLLELARESYKLRDNDNIYLGKIEKEVVRALKEAKKRFSNLNTSDPEYEGYSDTLNNLLENEEKSEKHSDEPVESVLSAHNIPVPSTRIGNMNLELRQLTGSSASRGIAEGRAFVFDKGNDIKEINNGDILVCDSIDPSMTIVIPVVSAIVERRGGMLVHGAIIAREYGIPCVTGIEHATKMIKTGDYLTVDGFLGIVTRHFN